MVPSEHSAMAEAIAGVSSVELEPPAVGVQVEPVELSTALLPVLSEVLVGDALEDEAEVAVALAEAVVLELEDVSSEVVADVDR